MRILSDKQDSDDIGFHRPLAFNFYKKTSGHFTLEKFKKEVSQKKMGIVREIKYFSSFKGNKSLRIKIPADNSGRVEKLQEGAKVTSQTHFQDVKVQGLYYGVTLRKGSIRKTNEDRVRNI